MRTITTASGIGDVIWIFMKLINQPEKFDWIFPVRSDQELVDKTNVQTRAFQLASLFPDLVNSISHQRLKFDRDVRPYAHRGNWHDIGKKQKIILEANSHLESGKRIEGFLPDLPTSFLLDFKTSNQNKKDAKTILKKLNGHKLCGIYTSNHAKTRDSWLEPEWVEFINLVRKYDPDYRFVFIAADYDWPLTGAIAANFPEEEYAVCLNEELGTVIEILKQLDLAITFQSGISIINELIGAKQTVMLYWNDQKHRNIIEAWPDPARIANGQYKGCVFCPPQQIFDWLVKNEKV